MEEVTAKLTADEVNERIARLRGWHTVEVEGYQRWRCPETEERDFRAEWDRECRFALDVGIEWDLVPPEFTKSWFFAGWLVSEMLFDSESVTVTFRQTDDEDEPCEPIARQWLQWKEAHA